MGWREMAGVLGMTAAKEGMGGAGLVAGPSASRDAAAESESAPERAVRSLDGGSVEDAVPELVPPSALVSRDSTEGELLPAFVAREFTAREFVDSESAAHESASDAGPEAASDAAYSPVEAGLGAAPVVPITTVALDRQVDVRAAAEKLRWRELRRYSHGSVYETDGGGRLYLLGCGAVVHDGVERLDRSILQIIEAAVGAAALPDTTETYYVHVDPERASASPRVGWDQVMIPQRSPELVGAVALLLGQSAALERYERAIEVLLKEALALSRQLQRRGRPPGSLRAQLRRIGRLTSERLELASLFYLLNEPEETWEDPKVAVLYRALFRNLDLAERHSAVLQKLTTVESATMAMVNSIESATTIRLEAAIVLLIITEIVMAFFKLM